MQRHDRARDRREGTLQSRRSPDTYEGIELLRFVHRIGRADFGVDRRRCLADAEEKADVPVYRLHARRGAPSDSSERVENNAGRAPVSRMENAGRLPEMPPGAELLLGLRVARRIYR